MNRKFVLPIICGILIAGLSVGIAFALTAERNNKTFEYSIGLWGDLPYSDTQALDSHNL